MNLSAPTIVKSSIPTKIVFIPHGKYFNTDGFSAVAALKTIWDDLI